MILPAKPLFDRFGTLHTWIVGIQYYEGRSRLAPPEELFFDREPENLFDPRAVAVFTQDGKQIGHLPRYDARHLAPLIDAGAIALVGRATGHEKGGRIPIQVDVHATAKLSPILAHDPADDWRAIYHNLLVWLWSRMDDYSADTLAAFRERLRDLAHSEDLYPKTEFLYRMMKAAIESRARAEQEADKERVLQFFRGLSLGQPLGWPELSVYPLAPGTPASDPQVPAEPTTEITVVQQSDKSRLLSAIAARCPYPTGTRGILVLTRNRFHSMKWFEDPSCAQVVWYASILDALDDALADEDDAQPPLSPDAIKAALIAQLERAEFKRASGGTASACTVRFHGDDHYGAAEIRDGYPIHVEYRVQDEVYSPDVAKK